MRGSGIFGGKKPNTPEIWRYNNYPGQWISTQLMAYYNDLGGLYVACDDPTGLPKFIDGLMDADGVTMGVGHYPATAGPGEMKLPYNVVLGTFHGDWYAAAEIYRKWALKQDFCKTRLADRKDCPKWLGDSPIGIAFPMRGQADWDGPAKENPEYTPATNALPYLEKLAQQLESPLMPIVFNWENGGPWVQPDAFPAVGGDADLREFMAKAKEKGWHPIIYGDGLCWVTWQKNTGYDGMPYFHSHEGESAVVRGWDGKLLEDVWGWRKNYVACVGTEAGRAMVTGMTKKMAEFGPDVIQQFDQGPGREPATPPTTDTHLFPARGWPRPSMVCSMLTSRPRARATLPSPCPARARLLRYGCKDFRPGMPVPRLARCIHSSTTSLPTASRAFTPTG
jgi:hypothetical protein